MMAKAKNHLGPFDDSIEAPTITRSLSFRGSFEHLIDDKGRVSVPSVFRDVLLKNKISGIVLTNFVAEGARCLEGYALPDWERFEAKLAKRSRFDPQVRKLEHFYLARAVECPLDASGRVTIPQHLRQYATLDKEIVFTSSVHGFRLWNKQVWNMIFQDSETALLDDPALFVDIDT